MNFCGRRRVRRGGELSNYREVVVVYANVSFFMQTSSGLISWGETLNSCLILLIYPINQMHTLEHCCILTCTIYFWDFGYVINKCLCHRPLPTFCIYQFGTKYSPRHSHTTSYNFAIACKREVRQVYSRIQPYNEISCIFPPSSTELLFHWCDYLGFPEFH